MEITSQAQHFIRFPSLGWEFTLNPILVKFSLFGHPFSIYWYGVLIALGFLLAVVYAWRRASEFSVDRDRMIDATLICTLFGFIGARLYYVFFCADTAEYLTDPLSIFAIWNGGIGIYGGVIFAFLSGIVACRVLKLDYWRMCDIASLGFLIGQAIGRWGNFFNQEAFGGNTTLPWGMTGDLIAAGGNGTGYNTTLPVHPTFLYESLWCVVGFILLHIVSKRLYRFKGEILCGYLVWYGVGRFFIESLRTDSLMVGTVKSSQLIAVIAVIAGIILFFVLKSRSNALPKALLSPSAQDEATSPLPTEEPSNGKAERETTGSEEEKKNGNTN